MTKDEDYDALSQKHLASIKRDTRISFEDAAVRATHKVMEQEPLTEWLVCPKCSYKSPYTPIKARTLAEDAERITKQARAALAQPEHSEDSLTMVVQPDLTDADRKAYQAGHNAGVAHHKQAIKREWVGLSSFDMDDITSTTMDSTDAMLLTEAKLKELNHE